MPRPDEALGLPRRKNFGNIEDIPRDQLLTYVLQRHAALRAGIHHDVRFGTPHGGLYSWAVPGDKMPGPGEKTLAIQQPLHRHRYRKFEGTIPKGQYGAGEVTQEDLGQVVVGKVSPNHIRFTVAHHKYPENYSLVRMGAKGWLLLNRTPLVSPALNEFKKVKYAKVSPEEVDQVLQGQHAVSEKIDGASVLAEIMKDKISVVSYRPSVTGRPIVHTQRIGGLEDVDIPRELRGQMLRAELYGEKGGRAIPPQDLNSYLNSSVAKSLEKQRQEKVRLKLAPFAIIGQDKKYSDTLKDLRNIVSKLPPSFQMPRTETDPQKSRQLFEDIRAGRNPKTSEGIVATPLAGGVPKKIKFVDDKDVVIKSIFPAVTKSGAPRAGGFGYSLTPEGKEVGKVGTGFSHETLRDMLQNPQDYVGRTAKIQSLGQFPSGSYRAPKYLSLHEDPVKTAMEKQADPFSPVYRRLARNPKIVNMLGLLPNAKRSQIVNALRKSDMLRNRYRERIIPRDLEAAMREPLMPRNAQGLLLRSNIKGSPSFEGKGWQTSAIKESKEIMKNLQTQIKSDPSLSSEQTAQLKKVIKQVLDPPGLNKNVVWATQYPNINAVSDIHKPFSAKQKGQLWGLHVPDKSSLRQTPFDAAWQSTSSHRRFRKPGETMSTPEIRLDVPTSLGHEVVIPRQLVTGATKLQATDYPVPSGGGTRNAVLIHDGKKIYSYQGPKDPEIFKKLKAEGWTFPHQFPATKTAMEKQAGSRLREMARMGMLADSKIKELQKLKMLPSTRKVVTGLRKGTENILTSIGGTRNYDYKTHIPVASWHVFGPEVKKQMMSILNPIERGQAEVIQPMKMSEFKQLTRALGVSRKAETGFTQNLGAVIERHESDEASRIVSGLNKLKKQNKILTGDTLAQTFPKKQQQWMGVTGHASPTVLINEAKNLAYLPEERNTMTAIRHLVLHKPVSSLSNIEELRNIMKNDRIPKPYRVVDKISEESATPEQTWVTPEPPPLPPGERDTPEKAMRKILRRMRNKVAMEVDLKKGDIILTGRFKNVPRKVTTIGTDELGQPIVNGRKMLSFRIQKLMPKKK